MKQRASARDERETGAGPVQPLRAQRLSLDRAKRARPDQPRHGSVQGQPSQRTSGYTTAVLGSVCGPLAQSRRMSLKTAGSPALPRPSKVEQTATLKSPRALAQKAGGLTRNV